MVELETTDDAAFDFVQGQYLSLVARIDGHEQRRSYSICSAPDEPLRLGIKRVEGGVFSGFAHHHFHTGMRLHTMPADGRFYCPLDPSSARRYLMLAAGSGITPVISNLKAILAEEPQSRVTLLYGNRNASQVMFADELQWLKNRYLSRFQWFNIFSRDATAAPLLSGRIDAEKLNRLHALLDLADTDMAFICGPQAMMEQAVQALEALGIASGAIHSELFFASQRDAELAHQRRTQRSARYARLDSRLKVRARGREVAFDLMATGKSVLEAALDAGLDLPFSCKGGVCATCKARLLEGEVQMDINHALDDEQIAAGLILTCQSHPVSDEVVIDFDVS